jgi:hypothetical protein
MVRLRIKRNTVTRGTDENNSLHRLSDILLMTESNKSAAIEKNEINRYQIAADERLTTAECTSTCTSDQYRFYKNEVSKSKHPNQ